MTAVMPFAAYLPAEQLHGSGVVAVLELRLNLRSFAQCDDLRRLPTLAPLRQQSVNDLAALKYVLYEANGQLTVSKRSNTSTSPLVQAALDKSVGFQP